MFDRIPEGESHLVLTTCSNIQRFNQSLRKEDTLQSQAKSAKETKTERASNDSQYFLKLPQRNGVNDSIFQIRVSTFPLLRVSGSIHKSAGRERVKIGRRSLPPPPPTHTHKRRFPQQLTNYPQISKREFLGTRHSQCPVWNGDNISIVIVWQID